MEGVGEKGRKGSKGDRGDNLKGFKGAMGEDGPIGPDGAPGQDCKQKKFNNLMRLRVKLTFLVIIFNVATFYLSILIT